MTGHRVYCRIGALLLTFVTAGCVSHSPVSELLIFHDDKTAPSSDNSSGFGMAVSMQPVNPARDAAGTRLEPESTENHTDDPYNAYRLSAGFYAARFDDQGKFAIAATFGIMVAGIDATAKLYGRNYLTAGVSAPRQFQAGLVHRAYNSRRLGIAVGPGYKREVYALPTSCYCYGPTENIGTIGGQTFFLYRPDGKGASGMKLGLYAGYAPSIDKPLFTVTLVTGRF